MHVSLVLNDVVFERLSRQLELVDGGGPVDQRVVDERLEERHQRLPTVSDGLEGVLARASKHAASTAIDAAQTKNVDHVGRQTARNPLGNAKVLA